MKVPREVCRELRWWLSVMLTKVGKRAFWKAGVELEAGILVSTEKIGIHKIQFIFSLPKSPTCPKTQAKNAKQSRPSAPLLLANRRGAGRGPRVKDPKLERTTSRK